MIVIAVLAIPFVFYFVQKPDYGAMRSGEGARMFDRSVPIVELQRNARLGSLAQALGMNEFWQALSMSNPGDNGYQEFALNLEILHHESASLGIVPTQAQVTDLIRNLSAFRGPNGFDPKKYDEFTASMLGPNGFTESQLEQLARDELSLKKIKEMIATGVSLPEAEVDSQFDLLYGKNYASVVHFNIADFAKDVKISDDDVKKYYEGHKDEFKSDDKRKIDFVRFALDDAQKKLTGKERVDILMKLQDRANDFSQALLEKGADFGKVAAKMQVPVEITGDFTHYAPDPKLKDKTKTNAVAFQLTSKDPVSDVVEEDDGYYILHLNSEADARPLTLEEAKPKILESLKTQRAREMLSNKASQVARELKEAAAAHQPLAPVCQKNGVKLEKIEPFAIADDAETTGATPNDKPKPESPDLTAIKNAAALTPPGEVSEPMPSATGALIVALEKRDPPDATKSQQSKVAFQEKYLKGKRDVVFFEWLRDRQRAAGLTGPA